MKALEQLALPMVVRRFGTSTATASEAAAALGCAEGQIVKTLVFIAEGRPTVVLCAGDRQVDTARLATLLGVGRKKVRMASASEVQEISGFPVGAVAPVGMPAEYDTVFDESLRRFEQTWAAAGTHDSLFAFSPTELANALGGQWAAVTREARTRSLAAC